MTILYQRLLLIFVCAFAMYGCTKSLEQGSPLSRCLFSPTCNRVGTGPNLGGNAEGYNGGDVDELKLRAARAMAFLRISDVSKNLNESRLCKYDECAGGGSSWCRALRGLTAEQVASCRNFITSNLSKFVEMDSLSPVPVKMISGEVFVTENGGKRSVDASTTKGEAIQVAQKSIQRLSSEEIQVVIFHELSHHRPFTVGGSDYPGDEAPLGGFSTSRAFLDTVAAGLMAYSQSIGIRGFFGVLETGYFGNSLGHYCSLADWDDWIRAGGPSDPSQIRRFELIPPSMIYDGVCNVPAPDNTPINGFFAVGDTGYFGNSIGQYCKLVDWDDWIRAGGPSNEGEIPRYLSIPPSMTYVGDCVVP